MSIRYTFTCTSLKQMMSFVDVQKPPVGARASDPGRLSAAKKTSVSLSVTSVILLSCYKELS